MRVILIATVALGVALVFYLSWLPQPHIGASRVVPGWLAEWTDTQKNDTIRTAVPFLLLGGLAGLGLAGSAGYRAWRWWPLAWLALTLVVLIAEAGQLFLPHRSFDWRDVAWGACGAGTGLALVALPVAIRQLLVAAR